MKTSRPFRLPKYNALRSCCNYDTITPQLNAQIDALLRERDALLKALKSLVPDRSWRQGARPPERNILKASWVIAEAEGPTPKKLP